MLALYPFETEIYRKQGVPVTYVGHPLADVVPPRIDRTEVRERLDIPADAIVFALLPGSRQTELQNLGELYIETAKRLHQRFPTARFLVPLVSRETRMLFEEALWRLNAQELPFTLMFGHAQDALAAADCALVASGTATLEAALTKTPMVITYRMSPFSWRLMNRKRYQPWVGQPNILAGRFVVPEILQDDATAENLSQALANLVTNTEVKRRVVHAFEQIHQSLRQGSAEKAAAAVLEHLPEPA
jgi:lipid-A-disaccharide synthase